MIYEGLKRILAESEAVNIDGDITPNVTVDDTTVPNTDVDPEYIPDETPETIYSVDGMYENQYAYISDMDIDPINELGLGNKQISKTPKKEVPLDFPLLVSKYCTAMVKLGHKYTAKGGANMFKNLNAETVMTSKHKNSYRLTISAKAKAVLLRYVTAAEFIEEIQKGLSSIGMKKERPKTVYANSMIKYGVYSKISKDKKYLFIAHYDISGGTIKIRNNKYFVDFFCYPNNAASRALYLETSEMSYEDAIARQSMNEADFDGYPESVPHMDTFFGSDVDLNMRMFKDVDPETYNSVYRAPEFTSAVRECFDMTDRDTRNYMLSLNEVEQGNMLTNLTSKLYDNIIEKVDDIDYGDIPATKGDITKLPNYDKLVECISLLRGILKEYKQDTGPVDELSMALTNLQTRKDLFNRAYKYDVELPCVMYCNAALGVINGVSYLIATCIEFIKSPKNDKFDIVLDKMAYNKSKNALIFNTLKKFNKSCKKGDMDKAMEYIIQQRVKEKTKHEAAATIGSSIAIGVAIIGIVFAVIAVLREFVFLFYYTRMRLSDFFDIQADLLTMNAYDLEGSKARTAADKDKIMRRQLKIADLFRKISNKFSFTAKQAEVKANKEIEANNKKKMKVGDGSDIIPDGSSSILF